MICVARFQADDTWYRAQVKALPGNKMVTVQYVDYGNTETVDITRLRKVLDTFLVLPIQVCSRPRRVHGCRLVWTCN